MAKVANTGKGFIMHMNSGIWMQDQEHLLKYLNKIAI